MRPQTYLFPGTRNGWRADKPITAKVIWEAVQCAAEKAGLSHCGSRPTPVSRPAVEVADVLHAQGEHFVNDVRGARDLITAIALNIAMAAPRAENLGG